MKEFITIGYSYNELNERAKAKVKEWYLNDTIRCDIFHDDIMMFLHDEFPSSSLRINFSLYYCQGDGFNIEGELDLCDFLPKWEADQDGFQARSGQGKDRSGQAGCFLQG